MKLTQQGLILIEKYESLKLKAYKCPAGKWTIGYGHTKGVESGQVCTKEQAEKFLLEDLTEARKYVTSAVKSKINDNQFSALVSFTFNCGIGNFEKSSLLKKVNISPNDSTIRSSFLSWDLAKGKVEEGLKERRGAEADLYFS